MITIQKYIRPQSLEEAYQLNQNRLNRILGGMLWLKMGKGNINTAIDLCELGLDTIEETEEQFTIGAMATLRQIELHQGLNAYTQNAAAAAVKDIVGVQFRNLATIGGSIWGRFGFSDVLTLFLAMEAYVELYKGGTITLEQFAAMKYDNDILVRLLVKKTPGKFVYSAMRNQRTDLPVITCALSQIGGEYRAVIGARPARAMVLRDDKKLLSVGQIGAGIMGCSSFMEEEHPKEANFVKSNAAEIILPNPHLAKENQVSNYLKTNDMTLTDENIKAFADYVAESTPTGSNSRGSAAYRTHLIKVLTQRNLSELRGMQ